MSNQDPTNRLRLEFQVLKDSLSLRSSAKWKTPSFICDVKHGSVTWLLWAISCTKRFINQNKPVTRVEKSDPKVVGRIWLRLVPVNFIYPLYMKPKLNSRVDYTIFLTKNLVVNKYFRVELRKRTFPLRIFQAIKILCYLDNVRTCDPSVPGVKDRRLLTLHNAAAVILIFSSPKLKSNRLFWFFEFCFQTLAKSHNFVSNQARRPNLWKPKKF
jgi:hypothetical protein